MLLRLTVHMFGESPGSVVDVSQPLADELTEADYATAYSFSDDDDVVEVVEVVEVVDDEGSRAIDGPG